MNTMTKGLVASVAAGAMALSSASPAAARDHRDNDGISAGDVIAGALVIGGIAAVAAAASNSDNDRYDGRSYGYEGGYYGNDGRGYDRYGRGGWNDRYGYGAWRGNPREAVAQCVQVAERNAARYSYGRADVTDVRSIRETRGGYEVRGRIAVNAMGRDWRDGDRTYGRGWNGDYRGWNSNLRGYDSGSFTCRIERGRVTNLDYDGIRGL